MRAAIAKTKPRSSARAPRARARVRRRTRSALCRARADARRADRRARDKGKFVARASDDARAAIFRARDARFARGGARGGARGARFDREALDARALERGCVFATRATMPRARRAPSRAEPARDASANGVPPTRTALFAPTVETGDRFRVDASVRKHTAEGGRAWTRYSPGRDDAPCVVGFGVFQADSRIASEYDEELRKARKLRRKLGLELVMDVRYARNRGTVQTTMSVETFIDGAGAAGTIFGTRSQRFRFVENAIRRRYPRRARAQDADDGPPCDADAAVAWLLRQPHDSRDSILVEFDRDTVRKPSFPYRVVYESESGDEGAFGCALTEAEFADWLGGWRPPPAANLDDFFAILRTMNVDLSGIDTVRTRWLCFEIGSGWANVSLALAETLGDDVLCIAMDPKEGLESTRAKNHPRVLILNEDVWDAQFFMDVRRATAGRVLHAHASPLCKYYSTEQRPRRKNLRDRGLQHVIDEELLHADSMVTVEVDTLRLLNPLSISVENPHNDADGIGSRCDLLSDVYAMLDFLVRWSVSYCHFTKGEIRKHTDLYVTRNLYDVMKEAKWKGLCTSSSPCAYRRRSGARQHKSGVQNQKGSAKKGRIPLALARDLAKHVGVLKTVVAR